MKISNWQYSLTNGFYSIRPDRDISQPSFLYKYYSFTDYNLKAFLDSQLYFSHPLVLNDIFDGSIQILNLKKLSLPQLINLYASNRDIIWRENTPDYHSIKDFVEREYRKDKISLFQLTLTFYWNVIFRKSGVLSLAGVDNDILLWSYYNNHTGFAIEFSNIPIDNKETFGPFPINYTETFEILYPKDINLPDEYLLYLINVKAVSWKHENEWRVLLKRDNLSIPNYPPSFKNDKNRLVSYPREMINSIILGYKFFKEFVPYEIDKKTYRFTIDESDTSKGLKLKLKFLKHLLKMNVAIKQVQTRDDNSFGIETNPISIEVQERNKIFIVTRLTEKRTPNLRFAHKPGDRL